MPVRHVLGQPGHTHVFRWYLLWLHWRFLYVRVLSEIQEIYPPSMTFTTDLRVALPGCRFALALRTLARILVRSPFPSTRTAFPTGNQHSGLPHR